MRISDWSSDVCSSDLYRAIFGAVVVQAVDAFIHEGGDEQRHADRQVPAEAKARQRILADMGDLADEAPRALERQHRDQRRGEHPRCRRSEEHTSELQSLMRTSYAVFSLQQTTHRTPTSTTIIHHHPT